MHSEPEEGELGLVHFATYMGCRGEDYAGVMVHSRVSGRARIARSRYLPRIRCYDGKAKIVARE